MASQKNFRVQREEESEMIKKFNDLMIDNKQLRARTDMLSTTVKEVSLNHIMAQWVDMEALENKNHALSACIF